MVSACNSVATKTHKESLRLQKFSSPSLLEVLQKSSNPLHTARIALDVQLDFRIQWIVYFYIWRELDFFWIDVTFWDFSDVCSF